MKKLMNVKKLFLTLCLICMLPISTHAAEPLVNDYFNSPRIQESYNYALILAGKKAGNPKAIAQKVLQNQGNYDPLVLLGLGAYFLSQHNLSDAALYFRLSMFRSIVDIRAVNRFDENPMQSMNKFISLLVGDKITKLPKNEYDQFMSLMLQRSSEVVPWDTQTPRNYDKNWVNHQIPISAEARLAIGIERLDERSPYRRKLSDEEKYQKILKQERKLFLKALKEDQKKAKK